MSPSEALLSSDTILCVKVLVLFAVAAAHPLARFLIAVSSLLLGDESTALGWLTAPNFILVISSQGCRIHDCVDEKLQGVFPFSLSH